MTNSWNRTESLDQCLCSIYVALLVVAHNFNGYNAGRARVHSVPPRVANLEHHVVYDGSYHWLPSSNK